MSKRWHLKSILRSQNLSELFADTPWKTEASQVELGFDDAVSSQDRGFLDASVPIEMLVYGAGAAGLLVYRSDTGRLRANPPGIPIALAWVITQYGSEFAEDLLEYGSMQEPLSPD